MKQMLELQQQLCDAENAAERLRDSNSDLSCANRDLTSKLEVLRADNANVNETVSQQSQVYFNKALRRVVLFFIYWSD